MTLVETERRSPQRDAQEPDRGSSDGRRDDCASTAVHSVYQGRSWPSGGVAAARSMVARWR